MMDNLFEDVDEELDMTNDSEALLQTNQSSDSVFVDGDTTYKDQTTSTDFRL